MSWHWCFSVLPEIHQKTSGCLMFSGGIEGAVPYSVIYFVTHLSN